ncbi:hypothetical protein QTO34_019316 [Cnephaeus nilssonii]|uniref:Uncharacterized protein n=1 Tax=Cnephaeus nilssonii TaxID=3371016 RepID=A0AA40HXA1_CNENI|nr:hypothetical protein QTO34_019316 [Eptesicus nilssonii]
MGKRNNSQRKENMESPRKEISETEACNMTEKEFRVMVMEFIHWMDEKINNLCKNQEEIKSDIATIKNTMESFNSRLQEAEDRLDMIKFRKEGMTKAKIYPIARPFVAVYEVKDQASHKSQKTNPNPRKQITVFNTMKAAKKCLKFIESFRSCRILSKSLAKIISEEIATTTPTFSNHHSDASTAINIESNMQIGITLRQKWWPPYPQDGGAQSPQPRYWSPRRSGSGRAPRNTEPAEERARRLPVGLRGDRKRPRPTHKEPAKEWGPHLPVGLRSDWEAARPAHTEPAEERGPAPSRWSPRRSEAALPAHTEPAEERGPAPSRWSPRRSGSGRAPRTRSQLRAGPAPSRWSPRRSGSGPAPRTRSRPRSRARAFPLVSAAIGKRPCPAHTEPAEERGPAPSRWSPRRSGSGPAPRTRSRPRSRARCLPVDLRGDREAAPPRAQGAGRGVGPGTFPLVSAEIGKRPGPAHTETAEERGPAPSLWSQRLSGRLQCHQSRAWWLPDLGSREAARPCKAGHSSFLSGAVAGKSPDMADRAQTAGLGGFLRKILQ